MDLSKLFGSLPALVVSRWLNDGTLENRDGSDFFALARAHEDGEESAAWLTGPTDRPDTFENKGADKFWNK